MAGPVPGAPSGRTSDPMVGRVLDGRYRLVGRLGTGASAVVYLAEDVRLRREVAVKVLHPALATDPGFLRRFQAEAQVAAGLRHPNVLAVHDWGEDDGIAYLVTEHLEGGSLRDLLDRGFRATPSQALLLGLQAARALDHAHRRGLVHRDIKPANLLFDADGRLRIADFGLARAIAEAAVTEPMGALLGTARYASPEQAEGRPLDGRSDVYSLGLVLIEALTGRVPFAAETSAATLMARVGHAVAPPPEAGPLTEALMTVGRPKPVDRPDAATFGQQLKACAADLPPPTPLPLPRRAAGATTAAGAPDDLTELAPRARPAPGRSTLPPPRIPAPDQPYDDEAHRTPAERLSDEDDRPRVLIDDAGVTDSLFGAADPDAGGARRPRRRRVLVLAVVVLVLLGGGAAAAATKPWLSTIAVPEVAGGTVDEAASRLRAQHLKAKVGERRASETVEANQVLGTMQTRAKEGSTVGLIVSAGPLLRTVPPLKGLPLADAQAKLAAQRLAVEVVQKDDETAPVGAVLDTAPPEGGQTARDTKVTLTVSDGPAPRPVPDLTNKTYDEAAAALTALGFAPVRADVFSDTVPAGAVVGTAPAAATPVKPGKPVTVSVSKGPDLVAVPTVAGRSPADAQAAMQATGLSIKATYGPPTGKVFDTDPKPGTKVKRGSAIALYTR